LRWGAALIFLGALVASQRAAEAQGGAFAGKTIRFIVATTPGGGYDTRGRTMAKYIGRHLPGEPSVVTENMPGGGSAIALNYLYAVAPKDGTVLCLFMRSTFSTLFDKPEAVKFDLEKFGWIGSTGADNGVVVAWHTAPHKTAQDLFTTEMIVAMPAGTTTQPATINAVIGAKMKIITGYPGAPEMQAAMERGEVMGLGEVSWSNLNLTHPDWVRDRKINILFQIGLKRISDLADVPLPQDFAKSPEERRILDIVAAQRQFAYPIVLPPGVPADRVAAWRKAFLELARDPDFMAEIKRLGLDYDPTPGEEMARNVREMTQSITPAMAQRIRAIVGLPQ
jgi:tripartite-type tricarboxylate transporter receptor subunit TctC